MLALQTVPSRAAALPVHRAAGGKNQERVGETCLYSSVCAAAVQTAPLKGAPMCDVVSSLAWSTPAAPP